MECYDKDLISIQEARNLVQKAKTAQKVLASFSQEQLDEIVAHVSRVTAENAEKLAEMAVEETGFGNKADKITKNLFASQKVYEYIKNMKTVGILDDDKEKRIMSVGVPLGVICALIPSTNPTSTPIYKSMIALKSGNAIVFSPHPNAQKCSKAAVDIIAKAAEEAGAPEGCVSCLDTLTLQGTTELMQNEDTSLILATGGQGMVRAAYKSGTPTISGGPGNGPAFIEKTADISKAVRDIFDSKTFDNGVICASEQSIVVEKDICEKVLTEIKKVGGCILSDVQSAKVSNLLLRANGTINPAVVGKKALDIAKMAGISIPEDTKVLISPQTEVSHKNPFSREKLCPILAFYCADDWQSACELCIKLLVNEGQGHTMVIHSQNESVIKEFVLKKPVSRVLVNTPASLGGIGATTNIAPALTLACGAAGGGSTSDNVSPLNLINVRKAAYGVLSLDEIRNPISVQEDNEVDTRFFSSPESDDNRFEEDLCFSQERDTRFENVNSEISQVYGKPSEKAHRDEKVEVLLQKVMDQLRAAE